MTKAEQIAEKLVLQFYRELPFRFEVTTKNKYAEWEYNPERIAVNHALITVDHILEMLNINPEVESVETYRHKLYTEVKQILEK